jgi:hypothetical protein
MSRYHNKKASLISTFAVQNGGQVRSANTNALNIKGVVGKSVGANSRIRPTRPAAIGIFSKIFVVGGGLLDLRLDLGNAGFVDDRGVLFVNHDLFGAAQHVKFRVAKIL